MQEIEHQENNQSRPDGFFLSEDVGDESRDYKSQRQQQRITMLPVHELDATNEKRRCNPPRKEKCRERKEFFVAESLRRTD